MKVLYIGGQNSGKSYLAEQKILELSPSKPFYIATYDNSYNDTTMHEKIAKHQQRRNEQFTTLEESRNLASCIQSSQSYLIDCVSMWIFNNLDTPFDALILQLEELKYCDATIVFVLNDVNSGIIPYEKETRKFVEYTGRVGQYLTALCDEVYDVKFGIGVKIK